MEYKTSSSFDLTTDPEGIVDTIFAVMGNIDKGGDILHPGSFTKTFAESGPQVKVLDLHQTDSINRVLGKPIELRELSRDELPASLIKRFPEATGGAQASIQFLMDTPEGEGAFKRIDSGAVDQWSFGYDALDKDFSQVKGDNGDSLTIRNLRTVRLYELSPVIYGMNPATTTVGTKTNGQPTEEKPWKVFKVDGKYCVHKHNEAGEKVGKPLGCHGTEEEAGAQLRALYANEKTEPMRSELDGRHPASHYLVVPDPAMPTTWKGLLRDSEGKVKAELLREALKEMTIDGPRSRLGDVLQGSIHKTFTTLADSWYIQGHLDRNERIVLSNIIGEALQILTEGIPDSVALRTVNPYEVMSLPILKRATWEASPDTGQADDSQPQSTKAGPGRNGSPTSTLQEIDIELETLRLELDLTEVYHADVAREGG